MRRAVLDTTVCLCLVVVVLGQLVLVCACTGMPSETIPSMHTPYVRTRTHKHTHTHTHTLAHTHLHKHRLYTKFALEVLFSVGFGIVLDIQKGKGGRIYKAALDIAGQSEESYYGDDEDSRVVLLDAAMGKASSSKASTQTSTHTRAHAHTRH